jgi:nucleoside-diphosphate-sugar epimerase
LPTFLVKSILQQRIKTQLKNSEPVDLPLDSFHWLNRPHAYSIQKAQTHLGYRPKVSLEEGLERVKTWLREHQRELSQTR